VSYRSNFPKAVALIEQAQINGLRAAVRPPQNEIKRALRGGYTSGDFITGVNINAVTTSEPFVGDNGRWRILVGFPRFFRDPLGVVRDMIYVLAWELGHINLFTRRYERQVRILAAPAARAAFAREFRRTIEGAGGIRPTAEAAD
jgi:hypothetical protein